LQGLASVFLEIDYGYSGMTRYAISAGIIESSVQVTII
jgi:hypothetical protein